MPFCSECAQRLSQHASKALFKERIGFHRYKKWQFTQCNLNLEKFICDAVGHVNLSGIIGTVKLSYLKCFISKGLCWLERSSV